MHTPSLPAAAPHSARGKPALAKAANLALPIALAASVRDRPRLTPLPR